MMGRGADGGCGTEEKPGPVSRVSAAVKSPAPVAKFSDLKESVSLGVDLYSQARKALSERSPFDSEEALASTVPTLPSVLGSLVLKHSDSRKRHKKSCLDSKSSKKGIERSKSSNIWVEADEYFRELTLLDIEKLGQLSNSLDSLASNSCFRIPVAGNAPQNNQVENRSDNNVPAILVPEEAANVNGMCSSSEALVVEEEPKQENGQDMNVGKPSSDSLHLNQPGCSPQPLQTFNSVEWVLGSRSKFLLTTERPTKNRKLLGANAGLQRLIAAKPCEGKCTLCHICSGGDTGDQLNQLVICKACNVAVHQKCYGVQGDVDRSWLCSWCSRNSDAEAVQVLGSGRPCVLCPRAGGALKPVQRAGGGNAGPLEFAHLFCSQWMPEVYVDDTRMMEPIVNIEGIKETRRKLVCNICRIRHGTCVRCTDGACRTSFHPICAREGEHRLEIWGKLGCDDVELRAFCRRHSEGSNGCNALQRGESHFPHGNNSSASQDSLVTLPVNKPNHFKLGHDNGDNIELHVDATNVNSDRLEDAEPQETRLQDVHSNMKDKPAYGVLGDFVDVETIVQSTTEDVSASESINLALVLRKIIDRGKVTLKEIASDIGVSADSLAAALADDHLDPDVKRKLTNWLKDRAYMGAPRKNFRVKMKSSISSKGELGVRDVSDTVEVQASDIFDVPVKSVPPRRRTVSNIRILKDEKVISPHKNKCNESGVSANQDYVQRLVNKEHDDSRKESASNKLEKMLVEPAGEDSLAKPPLPSESDLTLPLKYADFQLGAGHCMPSRRNAAVPVDQEIPPCSSMNNCSNFGTSEGSASGSYVNSYIQKRIEETESSVLNKLSLEFDGTRERKVSPLEKFSEDGVCSNDQEHHSSADVVDRYEKAKEMGIFYSCPDDEVEGEIIYFQSRLLANALARKHFSDDLIFKIVKNLPHEMDAIRMQRWDDVLVNQYLYGLREARKQGRKERKHREAQAVLAAATAASSRVSSLRKDDESSHQENHSKVDTSRVRGGHSQVIRRVKETTSSLAVPGATSDEHSDLLQFTSAFFKQNPRTCDICRRSETILNPILVCFGCKVAVHLNCYRSVKEYSGPWYCELCEELSPSKCSRSPSANSKDKPYPIIECGLCGNPNGAFRKSSDGQWIHAFCAEWVFESSFRRGQVNPVEGMETVLKGSDVCSVCHHISGVCIKCNYGHCHITFHPSCGRGAGYYMNARNVAGKLQHKAYCDKHSVEQRANAEAQKHGIEELKSLKQVRVELEKLRLLCERIVKREKLKRELVLCSHNILASKRDFVAFSMLVPSPFFAHEVSSESATTLLKGLGDGSRSCSEAMQKSDDVTVDSTFSGRHRIKLTGSVDADRRTDDSSTSQHLPTPKPMDRVSFAGKQIPYRASLAYRNISDGEDKRLKSRKHTETFEKELIMTSDQASKKNQRLPKGYIYVPIDCLSEEKQEINVLCLSLCCFLYACLNPVCSEISLEVANAQGFGVLRSC
ncbi:hypothetical protein Nepgr_002131 [Nepenthes gracilis]|uniref:Uncharacterized protein n=1 Tax=Nepenthes gracilis TaxID=150966 RepID=A0AAD3P9L5_NEPGR|nr:hypothetical protein Nepgr_002131 [Nepenthes gracilis]